MEIEYNYWTGKINEVEETLRRSIGQYIRHHKYAKIGITNNPERKMKQHSKNSLRWDKMVIKYRTSSIIYIRQIEKILVDYHWDYVKNEVSGGGGSNGHGPYYLYVLLK